MGRSLLFSLFSCEIYIIILTHLTLKCRRVLHFYHHAHHPFSSHHSVVLTRMITIWPNCSVHPLCHTRASAGVSFSGCSHLWVKKVLNPPRKCSQIHPNSILLRNRYITDTYLKKITICFYICFKCVCFFLLCLQIYIHCNTSVCIPTALDNCEPRCYRKSKLKIRETHGRMTDC